ncbi:PKS-ER domain-containing protein [Aphelenchoides fujianensis]|nr:PKS-ER domain-containing protein [Aphelenchoides fujianensis]
MLAMRRCTFALAVRRVSSVPETMTAWMCDEYKRPLVRRQVRVPEVEKPNQVLVKVKASSVNPIDVRMCEGYAHEMLSLANTLEDCRPDRLLESLKPLAPGASRSSSAFSGPPPPQTLRDPKPAPPNPFPAPPSPREPPPPPPGPPHSPRATWTHQPGRLPLIPGRDFSGEVVRVGSAVRGVQVGDEVIGVCPAQSPGSHAEFAITTDSCVALKPRSVDHVHAAAAAYAMATAWAAFTMARITPQNARGLRVLIHGGSGGVGTTAIQLLRAWNADKVVATASAKNLDLLRELGATAVDYNARDVRDQLTREAPFDVILDCAHSPLTEWSDQLLGTWRNSVHLSLVSPLMSNTDRYGVPLGLVTTAAQLFFRNIQNITRGRLFFYAFFWPDREAMVQLSELIDQGNLKPIIDEVRPFNDLPDVYERVGRMHTRGKMVLDFGGGTDGASRSSSATSSSRNQDDPLANVIPTADRH